jgi:hypothetical protein
MGCVIMPVLGLSHIDWQPSIFTFVNDWNLQDKFKEIYSVDIDNWEYDVTDIEAIVELLKNDPRKIIVIYDSESDGFDIYEVIE